MTTVFVATSNRGKQAEITRYSKLYGKDIYLVFPDESNKLDVDESGDTFEENALLKAQAYQKELKDSSVIFVGDDSGIEIPALNNEPGVHTRRWAGYEMTDTEIIDYCLKQMEGLEGNQRKATFKTVLAVIKGSHEPKYFNGFMAGHVLHKPLAEPVTIGLPFNSLFWVDEVNCSLKKLHSSSPADHKGFLTHREMAFKKLFESFV